MTDDVVTIYFKGKEVWCKGSAMTYETSHGNVRFVCNFHFTNSSKLRVAHLRDAYGYFYCEGCAKIVPDLERIDYSEYE